MRGFDPDTAAQALSDVLRQLGDRERAGRQKHYLKSDLEFFGVSVPEARQAVKTAAGKYPVLDPADMVAWAVTLWRTPVFERRLAAVEILTLAAPRLTAPDLVTVELLVRESLTWALVDGLACNVAGEIAMRDPASWSKVDAWAVDADFWVRRSALLALLRPIGAGQPVLARFTRYAEPMLAEREFFIRKAVGWVLRSISRRDPAWVASWTQQHISSMSGVTFREAVRHLPAAEAQRLRRLRPQ
jgi:3-methyladenine DNA glycosylase AlkD